MTNLIKSFEYSPEAVGFSVITSDGRYALIQATRQSNRLHADFGTHSLDMCDSVDCNQEFDGEEQAEIIAELEAIAAREVTNYLEELDNESN